MNYFREIFKKGLLFQGTFVSLSKIEEGNSKLSQIFTTQNGDLSGFVNKLFIFLISIGAMLAVMRLMWAGYLYMGSEMWTKKEDAKRIFVEVITGLLLLLAIVTILFQINPNLLQLDILTQERANAVTNQQPAQPTGSSTCNPATCVCINDICATARQ